VLSNDVRSDVCVLVTRQVSGAAEEPVSLRKDVEDAFAFLEL
jgi:hypothetical protein